MPLQQPPASEIGAVEHDGLSIAYTVVRSARRRSTYTITVEQGEVRVHTPLRASPDRIRRIVEQRVSWIHKTLQEAARRPKPNQFVNGESLWMLGRQVPLHVFPNGRAIQLHRENGHFILHTPENLSVQTRRRLVERAVSQWYRREAERWFVERVAGWARRFGREPKQVLVRSQRSRWGSCGPDGTIRLTWRLMQLEPSLIDYVIVHELAHLRVKSHGPRFWQTVAQVLPDYKERRKRLREFGKALVM